MFLHGSKPRAHGLAGGGLHILKLGHSLGFKLRI